MKTKKQMKYFTIFQYENEQNYLRKMHQAGWRFVKVNGFGVYHFEKCIPEDVIYQLDYNRDGIAHKEEYVKMFRDCGWEYLQDYFGYSYFRKSASQTDGTEEIFCDDSSRVQMMQRVFKGRVLPLILIFSAVLMPGFFRTIHQKEFIIAGFYGMFIAFYLAIFIAFAWKYFTFKNKK